MNVRDPATAGDRRSVPAVGRRASMASRRVAGTRADRRHVRVEAWLAVLVGACGVAAGALTAAGMHRNDVDVAALSLVVLVVTAALAVTATVSRNPVLTGLCVVVISGAVAFGIEPISPIHISLLTLLLTTFVIGTHWPGRALVRGPSLAAIGLGVVAAGAVAAASTLDVSGNGVFVTGLVIVLACVAAAIAPLRQSRPR